MTFRPLTVFWVVCALLMLGGLLTNVRVLQFLGFVAVIAAAVVGAYTGVLAHNRSARKRLLDGGAPGVAAPDEEESEPTRVE